jgi:all-trans-retinol dehydrogenase (NAD+)
MSARGATIGGRQPPSNGVGAVLVEFITCFFKFLWFNLVGIVKFFIPTPKKDLKKEIVLITGAGCGIGRLMAKRFASEGASVVLWDIDAHSVGEACEEIKGSGGRATAFVCDLSNKDQVYQTAAKVKHSVGDVTVLVNNAGIVTGKKFFETSDEMIQKIMDVNTMAHFWTIKAFVPDMISNNHGHIITIASAAGLFGSAGLLDYCASKFAAVGLNESLAVELDVLGCNGVNTTVVCPFFIDTGMFDGVKSRFPWILPILKPDYAVDKIMNAYHSNQTMLLMPRIVYSVYILQSLISKKAGIELANFLGVTTAMGTFKGRVAKKD